MSRNKLIAGAIVAAIAALLPVYFLWLRPAMKVISGYSAQVMCLQHFVAGRSPDEVYQRELSDWTARPTTITEHKVKTSTFFHKEESIYSPSFGCILRGKPQPSYAPLASQPMQRRINKEAQRIVDNYTSRKELYTRAVLVAHKGVIIAEAYGDGASRTQPHQGWSMTKSLLHAVYGIAIKDRLINFRAPPDIPEWRAEIKGRSTISLDDLFRMSSGLEFGEVYSPPSDVTKMLFTKINTGDFAAHKPMEEGPQKRWHYSSGTTNILSWLLAKRLAQENRDMTDYMRQKLFLPLGMTSMTVSPDYTLTPVASSFGFATAEDWLKLGQLYLQNGKWRGKQIVPRKWVKLAASPTKGSNGRYGHHWWINDPEEKFTPTYPDVPRSAYWAGGFNGQTMMVLPSHNMVVTRLGWTVDQKTDMNNLVAEVIAAIQP